MGTMNTYAYSDVIGGIRKPSRGWFKVMAVTLSAAALLTVGIAKPLISQANQRAQTAEEASERMRHHNAQLMQDYSKTERELNATQETLKEERARSLEALDERQRALDAAAARADVLGAQVGKLESLVTNMQTVAKKTQDDNLRLGREVAQARKAADELQGMVEQYKAEAGDAVRENAELRKQVDVLSGKIVLAAQTLDRMGEELERLKAERDEAREAERASRAREEAGRARIEALDNTIRAQQNQLAEFQQQRESGRTPPQSMDGQGNGSLIIRIIEVRQYRRSLTKRGMAEKANIPLGTLFDGIGDLFVGAGEAIGGKGGELYWRAVMSDGSTRDVSQSEMYELRGRNVRFVIVDE